MTLWISLYLPWPDSCRDLPCLDALIQAMMSYTPEVTCFQDNALIMDISASLKLYGGARKLSAQIRRTVMHMALPARLGMGPSALGAWVLARQCQTSRRRVLRLASMARVLDRLPIRYLPQLHEGHHDWLVQLGNTRFGQLRQLPRVGLAQRTSPALIHVLDAVYGKTVPHFDWHRTPDRFQARCTLELNTDNTAGILGCVQPLIDQLCQWLQVRKQAAIGLCLDLHHEKGRHARAPSRVTVGLAQPGWCSADFTEVLTEKLRLLELDAPVIAVTLHQVDVQPMPVVNTSLLPDQAVLQEHENRLIDLLRARLGPDRVLQPAPVDCHLPEQANLWRPVVQSTSASRLVSSDPGGTAHENRPCWLIQPAIRLSVRGHYPVYQGRTLTLLQGPERMETSWWEPGQSIRRDYFVAMDDQYVRYWIYRQSDAYSPGWFLQGLFA